MIFKEYKLAFLLLQLSELYLLILCFIIYCSVEINNSNHYSCILVKSAIPNDPSMYNYHHYLFNYCNCLFYVWFTQTSYYWYTIYNVDICPFRQSLQIIINVINPKIVFILWQLFWTMHINIFNLKILLWIISIINL